MIKNRFSRIHHTKTTQTSKNQIENKMETIEIQNSETKKQTEIKSDSKRVIAFLFGRSGHGKSTFGNVLLGKNAFTVSNSMDNITQTYKTEHGIFGGVDIEVVDTSGFGDGFRTKEENVLFLAKLFLDIARYKGDVKTVFCFCQPLQELRFTSDVIHIIEPLSALLGASFWNNFIIIGTYADAAYAKNALSTKIDHIKKKWKAEAPGFMAGKKWKLSEYESDGTTLKTSSKEMSKLENYFKHLPDSPEPSFMNNLKTIFQTNGYDAALANAIETIEKIDCLSSLTRDEKPPIKNHEMQNLKEKYSESYKLILNSNLEENEKITFFSESTMKASIVENYTWALEVFQYIREMSLPNNWIIIQVVANTIISQGPDRVKQKLAELSSDLEDLILSAFLLQNTKEAIKQWNRVIRMMPNNTFLHHSLGAVYENMGLLLIAKTCYMKSFKIVSSPLHCDDIDRIFEKIDKTRETREKMETKGDKEIRERKETKETEILEDIGLIKKKYLDDKYFIRELSALNSLNSLLQTMYDYSVNEKWILMGNNNLFLSKIFLDKPEGKPLNEIKFTNDKEKLNVTFIILKMLKMIHENDWVHYNICPENIIVNVLNENNISVQIINFEFAKRESDLENDWFPNLKNPIFPSSDKSFTSASDIFCIGFILSSIFGESFFKDNKTFSEFAADIKSCMELDMEKRPTAKKLFSSFSYAFSHSN